MYNKSDIINIWKSYCQENQIQEEGFISYLESIGFEDKEPIKYFVAYPIINGNPKMCLCTDSIGIGEEYYYDGKLADDYWDEEYQQDKENYPDFGKFVYKVVEHISDEKINIGDSVIDLDGDEGTCINDEDPHNIIVIYNNGAKGVICSVKDCVNKSLSKEGLFKIVK